MPRPSPDSKPRLAPGCRLSDCGESGSHSPHAGRRAALERAGPANNPQLRRPAHLRRNRPRFANGISPGRSEKDRRRYRRLSREVANAARCGFCMSTPDGPLALIAEITHRCPLHCVYCSNPLEMNARHDELSTEAWLSVFEQAGKLGTLQLDLTGGEPLARTDLTELIAGARSAKLYTNLITSGIGLTNDRLDALVKAGSRSYPAQLSGFAGHSSQRNCRRVRARTENRSRRGNPEASHCLHTQSRRPPPEPRSPRRNDRYGRMPGRASPRNRPRSVLRLGARKSRCPPAIPRAGRSLTRNHPCSRGTLARPHAHRVRRARLLRAVSESLHGRLGTQS